MPFEHIDTEVEANGLRFSVTLAGPAAGPAVILLHGFPDSRRLWRHQITALAQAGHRVIAPDLRGFGESDRPDDVAAYRLPALVGDVVGILDAVGVGEAAVVGHDWGAALAWAVPRAVPDRVTHLAAVSVGHPLANRGAGLEQRQLSWYMLWFLFPGVAERVLPQDGWRFYREWAWGGASPGSDADLDRQLADLSRPGALTAGLNWYRANIDPARYAGPPPSRVGAPKLRCPVMGVWSSEDFALGEEQMAASREHVAGPWRYERIDGCDHWVPVHAAEQLSALLVDFLSPASPSR
jgi:pimeloyl-ACP methyl ester carboxylesterase